LRLIEDGAQQCYGASNVLNNDSIVPQPEQTVKDKKKKLASAQRVLTDPDRNPCLNPGLNPCLNPCLDPCLNFLAASLSTPVTKK